MMQVSTLLDHIDSGHMALPEFQRGYVWNRDQVRGLMDSAYRRHPIGSLLVWATESSSAEHRGEGTLPLGIVKLLLDGQQRITTLYGVIRGKPPQFFDGNPQTFTNLYFHLERQEFAFFAPIKMSDDPLWIDVTALMKGGHDGLGRLAERLQERPELMPRLATYYGRLSRILGIRDINLHVEEVTGKEKTVDVVVDIFNRVNSGGTKLSAGDLALAKICAGWPEARDQMKAAIKKWAAVGLRFDLDWLLRCANTVISGEAKFNHLHTAPPETIKGGLTRAENAIDKLLNVVGARLGLDHDGVLFGRYAFPVMAHYVDRRGHMDAVEQDRMLLWYVHSALWGRFSGSTETVIDRDLKVIEQLEGGVDRLLDELQLWHGSLRVVPEHFGGWSLGARFYPLLYMLTRVGEARDLASAGLRLKDGLLGKMSRLEVHHIFPKALLYKHKYDRPQANAVANFCFLTKEANLEISDREPADYFAAAEKKHPGALASQWIPTDPALWKPERYLDFLQARRILLAKAANEFLDQLAHGAILHSTEPSVVVPPVRDVARRPSVAGGITTGEEEAEVVALNDWVTSLGLPAGILSHEVVDASSGQAVAVLDLAWPVGLQAGLSTPVAVLLNEGPSTLQVANDHGYRYFTDVRTFRDYVLEQVVPSGDASNPLLAPAAAEGV